MEVWGITEFLLGRAEDLRARGWAVETPDLFRHTTRPRLDDMEAVNAAIAGLDDAVALLHLLRARSRLPAPRFVIGWCLGGLYARMAACTQPGWAGAVEFYGRLIYPAITPEKPAQPLDLIPGLSCPFQAHFGDDDAIAPPHHVDALEARLGATDVGWQVFRYAGRGHGFMRPGAPTFSADVAERAWTRALTFLDNVSPQP
jgi:dienelactone hydrolase